MTTISSFTDIADRDLLDAVKRLAGDERQATAALIASLAELDSRRLYLGEGCSSLFTWCTQVLHLSEHAAYGRIEAARAARRFPLVLDLLAAGDVTLSAVGLLRPHLTEENHRELLRDARHKSKREVEQLVAELHPRPDVAAVVRKLPVPATKASVSATARNAGLLDAPATSLALEHAPCVAAPRPAVVAPLAPERYKLQVTIGRETREKLQRAQNLMRHAVPDGDLAIVLDRALTLLVEHLEKTKAATARRPRKSTSSVCGARRIPATVRRAVWTRDGGQCAFVGRAGRCTERAFLEFHHVVPCARGGRATVENIQLRCRAQPARGGAGVRALRA